MNKSELHYLIGMTGLGTSVIFFSASVFPLQNQLMPHFSFNYFRDFLKLLKAMPIH